MVGAAFFHPVAAGIGGAFEVVFFEGIEEVDGGSVHGFSVTYHKRLCQPTGQVSTPIEPSVFTKDEPTLLPSGGWDLVLILLWILFGCGRRGPRRRFEIHAGCIIDTARVVIFGMYQD